MQKDIVANQGLLLALLPATVGCRAQKKAVLAFFFEYVYHLAMTMHVLTERWDWFEIGIDVGKED